MHSDYIDTAYESAPPSSDTRLQNEEKQTLSGHATPLTLADGILLAAAVAAIFDIANHRSGTAAWIVLLGFALRPPWAAGL